MAPSIEKSAGGGGQPNLRETRLTPRHQAAHNYISQHGLYLIPLEEKEKRPAFRSGPDHGTLATNTIQRVDDWWDYKDFNIGLPCTINRIAVIDVDGPQGEAHLRELEAEYGELPLTWTQTSDRADRVSYQFIYSWPTTEGGAPELVPTGRISEQLEVRAHGAQIVLAPSIHPTGSTYKWITSPDDIQRAVLPAWILNLLTLPAPPDHPDNPEPIDEPAGLRPGDDYNTRPDTIAKTLTLLEAHGWKTAYTRAGVHYLVRPDKDARDGISASLGHPNTGHGFYVFTTTTSFTPGRRYSPFAVYTHLVHGDDYQQAAKALQGAGYGEVIQENPVILTPPTPATDLVDLATFLNTTDPPYDWIIEGLLERGDRVILTGTEGAGKTTLLRQIAVTTAAGIHPFTGTPIPSAKVAYIDLENSIRQSRRQFQPLYDKAGDQLPPDRMYPIIRSDGLDLQTIEDQTWLSETLQELAPDILVLGPIYKLVGGDPTEEQPAKHAATILDRLRTAHGFALLLEAHSPHETAGRKRPKRPYGASLWLRWPEFGLHISDQGNLTHWRGARDERAWPTILQRGGDWPWSIVISTEQKTWGLIVAHCQGRLIRPSIRDLERALDTSRGTIHRALEAHRDQWIAMYEEAPE